MPEKPSDAFLAALVHRLRGEAIGDGSVGRAIRGTGVYRTQVQVVIGGGAEGAVGRASRTRAVRSA